MNTPKHYTCGSITYTVSSPNELVTLYEHLHETNQLPSRLDSKHYSAPARLAWYRHNTNPQNPNHHKVAHRLTLSIYPTNQPATHITYQTEATNPTPQALHNMIRSVAHLLNETGWGHYELITNPAVREELYPIHRASTEAKYIYANTTTHPEISDTH